MGRFALGLRDVVLLLLAGLLVSFSGCPTPTSSSPDSATGKIEIDGSSTVFKLTQAVAEEFRAVAEGTTNKEWTHVRVMSEAGQTVDSFLKAFAEDPPETKNPNSK